MSRVASRFFNLAASRFSAVGMRLVRPL
jgi:hypothetical protein